MVHLVRLFCPYVLCNSFWTAEGSELVFPTCRKTLYSAWSSFIGRTGIEGLRFHDLRHEAISRFFERGLSLPEVAAISGHKSYKMLLRYTHMKPEEIALKLNW